MRARESANLRAADIKRHRVPLWECRQTQGRPLFSQFVALLARAQKLPHRLRPAHYAWANYLIWFRTLIGALYKAQCDRAATMLRAMCNPKKRIAQDNKANGFSPGIFASPELYAIYLSSAPAV